MSSVIFIFTKNKIEGLVQVLTTLNDKSILKIVIDDSFDDNSIIEIQQLCKENNTIYFGKQKQERLILTLNKVEKNITNFISELGTTTWNLGYARNYALLISAMLKKDKVLFLDDDILIKKHQVNLLFDTLDTYNISSHKVVGLIDNSLIGHLIEMPDETFMSGGCLAFNLRIVRNHFINVYNEDWIWQYFQSEQKTKSISTVEQILSDPFENYRPKILFQEIIELIIDGLLESSNIHHDLVNPSYWASVIENRKQYLHDIIIENQNNKKFKIISDLLNDYPVHDTNSIVHIFEKYQQSKNTFMRAMDYFYSVDESILL